MVPFDLLGFFLATAFCLTANFPTSYARIENTGQPEVTISQGTLLGTTLTTLHGRDVSAFLGIPYGQPPTGNLRFAKPVAAVGWDGTRDASVLANRCPQYESGVIVGDEDCLYLNVYTPQLLDGEKPSSLPVMVYIHGGGFNAENPRIHGPQYLLDADVLLVVLYYRLGPLGFLSTGDEAAAGNWGLKDQVLALEWVQDNIHHFNGDPDRVTIFGESAGAVSVHLLALSDATTGLFHRSITQSGSALGPFYIPSKDVYSSRAFELGDFVGCSNDTSDSLISCLRTVDFSDIIATDSQFVVWEFISKGAWSPVAEPDVEGAIFTESPTDLYAAGKIRDLPWMAGIVRDEGLGFTTSFYSDEDMCRHFLENIDTLLPLMLGWAYQSDFGAIWTKSARSFYFNDDLGSDTSMVLRNLTMLIDDYNFYYPTLKALRQQLPLAVNSQYLYSFNYRGTRSLTNLISGSTNNYGVTHGDDLIYLFPMDPEFSALNQMMSETDYEMVDTMVQLWTSFAINGIPTASGSSGTLTLEPFSTDDNYLRIGNESDPSIEVQYSFFEERMQFWADIDAIKETNSDSETGRSLHQF